MADPKKETFYADPTTELSIVDRMTGESTVYAFKDGKLETSDPELVEKYLKSFADTDGHPVNRKAPSSEKKA